MTAVDATVFLALALGALPAGFVLGRLWERVVPATLGQRRRWFRDGVRHGRRRP